MTRPNDRLSEALGLVLRAARPMVRPPSPRRAAVVLAVCAIWLAAGAAFGASLGGTVTDTGGAPLAGVRVDALTATGTAGVAVTGADGSWRLDNVAAGTIVLFASANGFAAEAWPDQTCLPAVCDPRTAGLEIVVAADDIRLDLDFELAPGAALAGSVRGADGTPLALDLRLYDDALGVWWTAGSSAADGSWRIDGLGAGTYRVATDGAVGFVDELFDGVPCPQQACEPAAGTPIAAVAGATVSGIDFVLDAEGQISGRVTRAADGQPVATGAVRVYSLDGVELAFAPVRDGEYTVGPLATGSYYVAAQDTSTLFGQLYAGVPCQNRAGYLGCALSAGLPVTVQAAQTTPNIDFVLSAAGSLSGRLRDVAGAPVGGTTAVVLDATGDRIASVSTDVLGDFRVDGLRPGPVYVGAAGDATYAPELYPDVICPALACDLGPAEAIEIVPNAVRTGFDLFLDPVGSITGRVTVGQSGSGLEGATILASTPSGAFAGSATSGPGGAYALDALPPVDLVLWARADGFRAVVHDGVPFPAPDTTDDFPLTAGAIVRPSAGAPQTIDFGLDRLPTIGGSLRDTDAMPLAGDLLVWRLDAGAPQLFTTVPTLDGAWSTTLWPGTFAVTTAADGSYVDEVFDDVPCFDRSPLGASCDLSAGTAFELDLYDNASGVSFELAPAGAIEGDLITLESSADGAPVVIELWSETAVLLERIETMLVAPGTSAPRIAYRFDDLAPGVYFLTVDAPPELLDRAVGGASCPGACDPLSGQPFLVQGTETIDAGVTELEPCGELCADDSLALRQGRFEIDVRWRDFDAREGVGRPVALTDESGYFWFFSDDNVEVVIKVLDACDAFGRFWVFAAGLTNVEVEIDVVDVASGQTRSYLNMLGDAFEPILDVDAFDTCTASTTGFPVVASPSESIRKLHVESHRLKVGEPLLLRDGRFVVETTWADFDGGDGVGTGDPLTDESGTFWFFDPANIEVIVKVLDACDVFDRYWVFAAGLTNVEVGLTVTDTMAGTSKIYDNPLGTAFQPILDVDAFATCP